MQPESLVDKAKQAAETVKEAVRWGGRPMQRPRQRMRMAEDCACTATALSARPRKCSNMAEHTKAALPGATDTAKELGQAVKEDMVDAKDRVAEAAASARDAAQVGWWLTRGLCSAGAKTTRAAAAFWSTAVPLHVQPSHQLAMPAPPAPAGQDGGRQGAGGRGGGGRQAPRRRGRAQRAGGQGGGRYGWAAAVHCAGCRSAVPDGPHPPCALV